MPANYPFGWLQRRLDIENADFRVRSAQRFDEAVANVQAAPTYTDRWFYPPLIDQGGIQLPAGRIELPLTHVLETCRGYARAYGEFLILVLGFFLGLRLTIQGTGHLTSVAVRPGTLVSFLPTNSELLRSLGYATEFWDQASEEQRSLAFAAIHGHLLAQSYRRQYEEFVWHYMVLDNIHRLTWARSPGYRQRFPNGNSRHADRPANLTAEYRVPLPRSFADEQTNCGRLITTRNQLVHEARWLGHPVGYAAGGDAHDLVNDLKHLNSQLILGCLGIRAAFQASTYDQMLHALDMDQ